MVVWRNCWRMRRMGCLKKALEANALHLIVARQVLHVHQERQQHKWERARRQLTKNVRAAKRHPSVASRRTVTRRFLVPKLLHVILDIDSLLVMHFITDVVVVLFTAYAILGYGG